MRGEVEGQVVVRVVHLRIPITLPRGQIQLGRKRTERNVSLPASLILLLPPPEMLRGVVAVATITIQKRKTPGGATALVATDANRREAFPSELFNSSASSVCVSFLLLCRALPLKPPQRVVGKLNHHHH